MKLKGGPLDGHEVGWPLGRCIVQGYIARTIDGHLLRHAYPTKNRSKSSKSSRRYDRFTGEYIGEQWSERSRRTRLHPALGVPG